MNHSIPNVPPLRRGFFDWRSCCLAVVAGILILILSAIGPYRGWVAHIDEYYTAYDQQQEDQSLETRRTQYYGQAYIVSVEIKKAMIALKAKNPLILFPSNAYCEKSGIPFRFPEPAVFYYYTNLHATTVGSPLARKATYLVTFKGQSLEVLPAGSQANIEHFCRYYAQFNPKS